MSNRFDLQKNEKKDIPLYDLLSDLISSYVSVNKKQSDPLTDGMRFDIKEEEDRIVLTAKLPGFSKNNIKVTVDEYLIYISGERIKETVSDIKSAYSENYPGWFSKAFYLPAAIDQDRINAVFRENKLTVDMPKSSQKKEKEVVVEVK